MTQFPQLKTTRLATARLWVVRAVLLYATVLYFEIGRRFMVDPAGTAGLFSIVLPQPESVTTIRTIMGAFFLGLSATALYGLVRQRMAASLWVLVTFIFFVLCGRLLGIELDGATPINLSELRNEAMGFAIYAIALVLLPRKG